MKSKIVSSILYNYIFLLKCVINISQLLFNNFQNDYNFSNHKDLEIKIITIIGFNYWLNFNLNTDQDYIKMECKLVQIYHIN